MARPLRIQYPGALYHITNRGNGRKKIFVDDIDRTAFLKILSQSIKTYSIQLYSYVLMDNHYHILAQTSLANLSEFMRHFNITYTSHFNRRHNRSGNLYQGRYKSFLVDKEPYLTQVSRYIHLNPVRVSSLRKKSIEQRSQYLLDYKWSSLPGFLDSKHKLDFIEYDIVLEDYGGDNKTGRKRYLDQIVDDLQEGLSIKEKVVGQSILGSKTFVNWAQKTYIKKEADRETPAVKEISKYLLKNDVLVFLKKELGFSDIVTTRGTTRQIVMTVLYKYAGLTNKEIGDILGLDYSTISQGRKRLRGKVEKDRSLQTMLEKIESELSRVQATFL